MRPRMALSDEPCSQLSTTEYSTAKANPITPRNRIQAAGTGASEKPMTTAVASATTAI